MVVASGGNSFTKEMSIRRRISSIFNKREEDFPSLKEYNDYLEEVEDMIVNFVEGIDVPAIEVKIAQYQRENAEQIMVAHARKAEDYAAALAASKSQPMQGENGASASNNSQAGTSAIAQGQYAPAVAGGTQPRPLGMAQQPATVGYGSGHESEDAENMKQRFEKAARGEVGVWSLVRNGHLKRLLEAFGYDFLTCTSNEATQKKLFCNFSGVGHGRKATAAAYKRTIMSMNMSCNNS